MQSQTIQLLSLGYFEIKAATGPEDAAIYPRASAYNASNADMEDWLQEVSKSFLFGDEVELKKLVNPGG